MVELNQLYVADVLDFLSGIPDSYVDCAVTSPPYNVALGKPRGGNWQWTAYDNYHDEMPEDEYQEWQIRCLAEMWRALKPTGSLWYNHKVRQRQRRILSPLAWIERSPCPVRQEIIWVCGPSGNINNGYFHAVEERVYWLAKEEARFNDDMRGLTTVWNIPKGGDTGHPAPFPLGLPMRCIAATTGEGDIVLDPFCGTGTTCLAAAQLGRQWIGCDISERYIEVAKQRLAALHRQPRLL